MPEESDSTDAGEHHERPSQDGASSCSRRPSSPSTSRAGAFRRWVKRRDA